MLRKLTCVMLALEGTKLHNEVSKWR